MKRLRLGIIFGGRSVEHEVSLVSARSLLVVLDPDRYEVVPIGVTREGKWLTSREVRRFLEEGLGREGGEHAALVADPTVGGLLRLDGDGAAHRRGDVTPTAAIDVVFPLIHGGYGEDGKLQGLLEMADLPYVGAGVLGSAIGMDKEVAKRLFRSAGLPVVDSVLVRAREWNDRGAPEVRERIEAAFGHPCFVKPASLGSSVGVARCESWPETERAITAALEYDEKVLIERAIDAREIEVAVLGNDDPRASICGEIVTTHDFYDYEAKYHDTGTKLLIPAPVSPEIAERVRALALEAFLALELSGMARVDFLLERVTGTAYLNEVNTIPGFTPVSMYPKLWEASGLPYPALIDRLIELALERHRAKHALRATLSDGAPEDRNA